MPRNQPRHLLCSPSCRARSLPEKDLVLSLMDNPDPLGVLRGTLPVVERAGSVRIDFDAVNELARRIADHEFSPPEWESDLHWSGEPEETANFILVLDALNFCFWGEPRWIVTFEGREYNGYWALAAALTRAIRQGIRLTDAAYLTQITERELAEIFTGDETIPLLPERVSNLREVGRVLIDSYQGQFAQLIADCNGSAIELVRRVVAEFPSFNDVATFTGREVRFYKRAQILASDLAGAFNGQGLGQFHDLDRLTAFADYKVPQVLHQLDVLRYDVTLTNTLAQRVEIAAGHPYELEIRAATLWSVEVLRQALDRLRLPIPPYQLDWMLWQLGQELPDHVLPYHRTRTIFY